MPAWLHRMVFRLQGSFFRRRGGEEFSSELESHLELLTQRNEAQGMALIEARRVALIQLGGLTQIKEDQRERRAIPHLDTIAQDLRHAFRLLRKAPGFTAIAVLTLALGIGLSTTVFTIYDSVAVRLLPVSDAASVVRLMRWYQDGSRDDQFTTREFEQVRSQVKSLHSVIAASPAVKVPAQDHAGVEAELIQAQIVSPDYFTVLGIAAQPGRSFSNVEAQPVAVLSNRFWKRRFSSDPALPGRSLLINGTAFVSIGVAPESFAGTGAPPMTPDVWIPIAFADLLGQGSVGHDLRVQILGRRNPGATSRQLAGELAVLGKTLESNQLDHNKKLPRLGANAATFFDTTGGGFEVFLWVLGVLMAAVGSVLLVGCVNLVNLLLARAVTRRREIVVRCALGAGRGRIVRQLCTESLVLGFMGGLVGLLFSIALCRLLASALATRLAQFGIGAEYLFVDLSPNYMVFLYAFSISIVTGILVGLGPARQATRGDVGGAIKAESVGATGGRNRFRTALIAAQVAVCLTLLTAAGLLGRGVQAASHADPGFETKGLFMLAFPDLAGRHSQLNRRLEEVAGRLESTPQIQSVSLAARPPLMGHSTAGFEPIGSAIDIRSREASSLFNFVSPSYFRTLGIPIVRGRTFTRSEVGRDAPVIVISEQTARRYWPGEEPLGRRISVWKQLREPRIAGRTFTVIGISKSVRSTNLSKVDAAYIYFPGSTPEANILLVRATAAPNFVATASRSAVSGVDRALADQLMFLNIESGPVQLQRLMTQAPAIVAAVLGCLGLLLASVGIYGVVSHLVGQRTQEIGIRMALGADRGAVMALVFRQALKPLLWGVPAGLAGSALVSYSLGNMLQAMEVPDLLYGINPWNPASFAMVLLLLMLVVWAASWVPARRAMRIDPSEALRYG